MIGAPQLFSAGLDLVGAVAPIAVALGGIGWGVNKWKNSKTYSAVKDKSLTDQSW